MDLDLWVCYAGYFSEHTTLSENEKFRLWNDVHSSEDSFSVSVEIKSRWLEAAVIIVKIVQQNTSLVFFKNYTIFNT